MLSERLKSLRKEKAITQQELADVLDTSRSNIASYEQGINEPGIDMIKKMIDYFNVTVEYLVGLSPYKNFEEQAKHREINITKPVFNKLSEQQQKDIIDLLNIYIDLYASLNEKNDYLINNIPSNNSPLDFNLRIYYLLNAISHHISMLKNLNDAIEKNCVDTSLSPDERETNINFDLHIKKIRKSQREMVEMCGKLLDDLLYCLVIDPYHNGKDNKLI